MPHLLKADTTILQIQMYYEAKNAHISDIPRENLKAHLDGFPPDLNIC